MTALKRVGLALAEALIVVGAMAPPLAAGASNPAWTTAHGDPARSGNDTLDAGLAGMLAPSWTSDAISGRVYGEPLFFNGVVYVASQSNIIYALDAGTGHVLWQVNVGATWPAVPHTELISETGVSSSCGNIDPLGVTGSPVVDPSGGSAGLMFAVAETYTPGTATSIQHRLLRVDLATHAFTSRNIDPPVTGFADGHTRGLEQQRGALNLAGGEVIVPYGGLSGDCGGYHGFVLSSLEDLTGAVNTFEVDLGNTGGGVWAASGAAVDGSNNVYVSTGNGNEASNGYAFTDGVMKLGPTMGQPADTAHYFAPDVWHADNARDADMGSLTPTLIPRPGKSPLIFATGKQQIGFLLDSANLGGIGGQLFPPKATEATTGKVCDGEAFGGTAYANGYLYVPCSEGLRALTVDLTTPSFARAWGPVNATGPPIVVGGRVWAHGSNELAGFNATSGNREQTIAVNTPYNFASPSAGGGRLFFPTSGHIAAYEAAGPAPPPPGGTNLYGVLVKNGGSGRVEVHGLSQQSHYSQFMLHAATAFAAANTTDWQFFVAPYQGDGQPDLVGVHVRGTASGQVEVHVLSAASGYSAFVLHTATPLAAVPTGRFAFTLGSLDGDHRSNLYAIGLNNTASGTVEVHALSETNGYNSWALHSTTALAGSISASAWQFRIGDPGGRGDLVGISHSATSSGRTEVHTLARVGGYNSFTLHTATPLRYTSDANFAFTLGDHDADGVPDLYAVEMSGTGSGSTEVHVLAGSSGFASWAEHAATGLGATDPALWEFSAAR
jgi:outer membrane protein assembly factor BamB